MNVRLAILAVVLVVIIGSIIYIERGKPPQVGDSETQTIVPVEVPLADQGSDATTTGSDASAVTPPPAAANRPPSTSKKAETYPLAVEIARPTAFLNAQPFTLQSLIGKKVILVDFWTYSCINCQRTLPYLNAWYQKYKDQGLEIVGIHTPEFDFEKNPDNVRAAIKQFGVQYPVVMDNDAGTWNAYRNRYWPHKYLIDINGYIVYDHIGEGFYDETERKIQELLRERAAFLGQDTKIAQDMVKPKANGSNLDKINSPEIYFGYSRNTLLANGTPGAPGSQMLTVPGAISLNRLYLGGSWEFQSEYAKSAEAGARIVFKYDAKDVYIVASADTPVKVRVLRDGQPVGTAAGADAPGGTATVQAERLYKLIQDPSGYGTHTLELIIESPGLKAFTFTFG